MARGVNIDGVLITWGDRLFYPGNRMVRTGSPPKLDGSSVRRRAAAIRSRIAATVARRAPQVMVKVTGGGRGMKAIAAHFRYIGKNGLLDIEDDRGETLKGKHAVRDLTDDWRFGGRLIPEDGGAGGRREAFNIMLSMPRGTDPLAVHRSAREFARTELAGHKYVMVLHDHQANPHVHISVRAESRRGGRLNPRKADLRRWRETFAEKLRAWGIEAEASSQTARLRRMDVEPIWRVKARGEGRLRSPGSGSQHRTGHHDAHLDPVIEGWRQIARALATSIDSNDLKLASSISAFLEQCEVEKGHGWRAGPPHAPDRSPIDIRKDGRPVDIPRQR